MRTAKISRTTTETKIDLSLTIEGKGGGVITTGIGFFDHMLDHFRRHGLLDLDLRAEGDLHVDYHHTVEDVGLCLGDAIKQALGDKAGVNRYGLSILPMDEALAWVTIDLSGRPLLVYSNPMNADIVGTFPLNLVPVFLQAMVDRAAVTLHASVQNPRDPHHSAEAIFKALGRAFRQAVEIDPAITGVVPSTKGVLE